MPLPAFILSLLSRANHSLSALVRFALLLGFLVAAYRPSVTRWLGLPSASALSWLPTAPRTRTGLDPSSSIIINAAQVWNGLKFPTKPYQIDLLLLVLPKRRNKVWDNLKFSNACSPQRSRSILSSANP